MAATVVLAEDDPKQAELIRLYLAGEGHALTIVQDGHAAVEAVRRVQPDLLVLDGMLPGLDGLDVCRVLRQESDLPVLMLTARCEEEDLLRALDGGADDYMTKPFNPRELAVRVRALLRRARSTSDVRSDRTLRVGAITVDVDRHQLSVDEKVVPCTATEFRLMETMASRPHSVFTRSQLIAGLHGFEQFISARIIDTHVLNLRKKIEVNPRRPTRLVTVYGVGYKLTDDMG